MKLMIASDLHGSAYSCRKLLDCYRQERPDKLLLLGDLLYHGPRNDLPREYEPKAVIAMLNEIKSDLLCVRGNCDTEVDQMVLEFPIMAEYAIIYEQNSMIFATHGHHYHRDNLPLLQPGDILLHGHTHIPANEQLGSCRYLNPGSVAIPKQASQAGYLLLEQGMFSWKTLEGEVYEQWQLGS